MLVNSSSDWLSLDWSGAKHYQHCYQRMEKASACLCSHKRPIFRIFTVSSWTTGQLDKLWAKVCFVLSFLYHLSLLYCHYCSVMHVTVMPVSAYMALAFVFGFIPNKLMMMMKVAEICTKCALVIHCFEWKCDISFCLLWLFQVVQKQMLGEVRI